MSRPLRTASSRSAAGEGLARWRRSRRAKPRHWPLSAATCRRRSARASACCGQPSTAAQAPLRRHCSNAHSASRGEASTMRSCDRSTPAACQAGAYGRYGGATSTTRAPSWVQRARVGNSSDSSPTPSAGSNSSVSARRGQPPCGSSASSAACPVGSPSLAIAALRPACHSVRAASRVSRATTALMPSSAAPGRSTRLRWRNPGRGRPRSAGARGCAAAGGCARARAPAA